MKKRLSPYAIALLAAALLAVIPAAILPDLAIPMKDNWENWYWSGQPHPRPQFSLANPPPLFRAELTTYKFLVVPPALLRRAAVGWPTAYGSLFVGPYGETAGFPPLAFAIQHLAWALPLWFIL